MNKRDSLPLTLLLALVSWMALLGTGYSGESLTSSYNIVWTSPSRDSLDSMPLSGRRGAGANVWVQDGSIWLYLAHSGAFDEHGRLFALHPPECVQSRTTD